MPSIQLDTKKLIGMDEVRASRLIGVAGGIVNVTIRDGFPLVVNTDFRMNRINLEIKNGIVVKCYAG
jgi:hypothetical protein